MLNVTIKYSTTQAIFSLSYL
jgi:hypothetical protein